MLSEEYDETPGPGWGGVINWGRLKPYAIDIESSFKFVWAHDIGDDDNHKEWIVRNIFGAGEFSYIVGLPGAGKSMCATDIACHVAAGWDWHGFKVKEPGFVLYVAAERAKLTNRRIRAWRKKHKHAGKLPVLVVSGYMNLTENRNHAIELIELIKIASAKCGLPCHLVVIDTLTRVFGGGDQNTSKDMSKLIDSVDMMQEAVPTAHFCIIHHTTHAGERAKGAIDLDGAVDVSFLVSPKSGVVVFENTGANDGKEGDLLAYEFESVTLGKDDDGEWTTAPVLVPVDMPAGKDRTRDKDGKYEADVLSIARHLMDDDATPLSVDPGRPSRGKVLIPAGLLREAFLEKHSEAKPDTVRKAYARVIKTLSAKNKIDATGGFIDLLE